MSNLPTLHTQRGHHFTFRCYDRNGNLKWTDTAKNLVVDEGLDELLDRSYDGASVSDALGLTDGTPNFQSDDDMDIGTNDWAEVTDYDESDRPALNFNAASDQSKDNDGNEASFSINSDNTTVGGAFITSDNTKGGSSGTLIGGAAFDAGDKTLDDGDTLEVTVTATASSS